MSKLDDYLLDVYSADPTGAVGFANKHYRLVHISRRWWRGYKVMTDAAVQIDGRQMDNEKATRSRWKLIPDDMKEDFQHLDRETDQVIRHHCVAGSGGEDATPVIVGGGNYVVPTEVWPRIQVLLKAVRDAWSGAADRWCTEDGYAMLHRMVKEKFEDDYDLVKDLIPDREVLRGKFGLIVSEVPVRIIEDEDLGAEAQSARAGVFAEMMSAAVRRPRLELAEVCEDLADKLITPGAVPGTVAARQPESDTRTKRGLNAKAILAVRRMVIATERCGRAVDSKFGSVVKSLVEELPHAEDAARQVAIKLNADDDEAVRVGQLLTQVATVARDESSMCDAVAAALGTT